MNFFRRHAELPWLGAEALPGDLAEINRVNQAWLEAAARHQRYVEAPRQRGFSAVWKHRLLRRIAV